MKSFEYNAGRAWMGRLTHGADLLAELNRVTRELQVTCGCVQAIGAVQRARLGFYDQQRRVYEYLTLERPLELTSLAGNVSLKDGEAMVHAHANLADESGRVIGGHVAEGTIIFACEFILQEWRGQAPVREFDPTTGLFLWPAGSDTPQ